MESLVEFERTERKPWINSHDICLKASGVKLALTIPHHGIYCVTTPGHIPGDDQSISKPLIDVLNHHELFLLSIQASTGRKEEELRQQAREEVKAISLFFPLVRSRNVRICMAAWLGIFCAVDDMVETMPPSEAEHALRDSIILPGKVPRGYRDTCQLSRIAAVLHLVSSLREHSEQYLPEPAAGDFFHEISATFDAYIKEMKYRQGQLPNDLEFYMTIRKNSIGIAPFFSLIKSELYPKQSSPSILSELQNQVSEIVGLQNDLLGLEKDIKEGETMNAVIVAMRDKDKQNEDGEGIIFEAAITICNLHNLRVSRVMERFEVLEHSETEGLSSSCETMVASMQLFIETHFMWCQSSGRYQTGVE